MGLNVWPADAVGGLPSYAGRMLRQMFGSAGRGAARCESAAEVGSAMRNFPQSDAWSPNGGPRYVVQRWIHGDVINRASLAWDGKEIAGFTRGRLATRSLPRAQGNPLHAA